MRKNEARLNLIVGSFVLGMGSLLVLSIFVIGQGKGTWKEKATIAADFRQVSGLKKGSPVQLEGIEIVAEPQLSLVAFRLAPQGITGDALDALNRRLLERINGRHRVHPSGLRAIAAGGVVHLQPLRRDIEGVAGVELHVAAGRRVIERCLTHELEPTGAIGEVEPGDATGQRAVAKIGLPWTLQGVDHLDRRARAIADHERSGSPAART